MHENENIWPSVTIVALVAGAVTAFLYTDRGRQSLMRFDEALDDFGQSLQQLRGAIQKAGLVATQGIDVAAEGVQAVSGLIGKGDRRPNPVSRIDRGRAPAIGAVSTLPDCLPAASAAVAK